MPESRWQRVADDRWLLELASPTQAAQVAERLRAQGKWREVTSGSASVVVQIDLDCVAAGEALQPPEDVRQDVVIDTVDGPVIEIPARYDPDVAPDLLDCCAKLGLSVAEFVRRHTAATHRVAMLGFMPGFAYLEGLDERLRLPRHDAPRPRIEAGSIGIAGSQTGLYPFAGPGGWRIVARTELTLFDPAADPPALLAAGTRVRFVPDSTR